MTASEFIAAREALGLSQAALAERLLCSERLVQYMEKGQRTITRRTALLLDRELSDACASLESET